MHHPRVKARNFCLDDNVRYPYNCDSVLSTIRPLVISLAIQHYQHYYHTVEGEVIRGGEFPRAYVQLVLVTNQAENNICH